MVKKVQELQSTLFQKEKMLETCTMHIKSYQRELEEKSAEIENLQNSLGKVSAKRDKLERHFRRLCRSAKSSNGLVLELSAIPRLFELIVEEAKEAASSFAGLLITSMQSAQWDLDAAACSIEPGIIYASPDHKRFAFESYVCHRMFSGFENENFYINGSLSSIMDPEKHRHECLLQFEDMRSMDPLELVSITPDCLFGRFCHRKYLHLVHEKMEECFFGHSQHRAQVLKGEHPRSRFYQSFLKFAKAVWLVHRLAFSFSPAVNIFQVRRNSEFHPDYMESVVQKIKMRDDNPNSHPKVGLTVTPGFCVGKAVLKCQVYLDDMVATE
ncbi:hypothetical protein O6H91_12G071100 [Diphasiastrum complanatum]|nr:hypothetical protein O6H91_12G071100 [Diphasiastrum complanatum]